MDIVTNKEGAVSIVGIKGRLDALTSKRAEEQLLKLVDSGERFLVLDMAELDYMSSVGLRVLILLGKRLKQAQGRVVVCALQESIQQIFEIAGFTKLFPEYRTRTEAVAALT